MIKSWKEIKKEDRYFPIRLFVILLFVVALSIWRYIHILNMAELRAVGIITLANISGGKGNSYTNAVYYRFIVNDTVYSGAFSGSNKYTKNLYKEKITIKYLPSNPKMNKPMYLLYKRNAKIREKYKYEFIME